MEEIHSLEKGNKLKTTLKKHCKFIEKVKRLQKERLELIREIEELGQQAEREAKKLEREVSKLKKQATALNEVLRDIRTRRKQP